MPKTAFHSLARASVALVALAVLPSSTALAATERPHLSYSSLVEQLSCPSSTTCYLTGYKNAGGLNEHNTLAVATSVATHGFTALAELSAPVTSSNLGCKAASSCYLGTTGGLVQLTSTGRTRTAVSWSGVDAITGVSCPTVTRCVAVGDATHLGDGGLTVYDPEAMFTTDGGAHWHQATLPSGFAADGNEFGSVTCSTSGRCLATNLTYGAAAQLFGSTTFGATWYVATSLPYSLASSNPISCADPATPTSCVAAGVLGSHAEFSQSTDAGRHWSTRVLPTAVVAGATTPSPQAVACSGSVCVVGANQRGTHNTGRLYRSVDRGVHWSEVTPASAITQFSAVAAPSASVWLAAGVVGAEPIRAVLYRSVDHGAHWSVDPLPLTLTN